MVELLNPPLRIVDRLAEDSETATVLVDCGLGTSNHLATRDRLRPVAVIDHHAIARPPVDIAFADIRPGVAATATIVANYLREQGIEPGVKLASAMLYAMRTETCGCETEHSELDRSIMLWLTEHAEPGLIAEIENAPWRGPISATWCSHCKERSSSTTRRCASCPKPAGPKPSAR